VSDLPAVAAAAALGLVVVQCGGGTASGGGAGGIVPAPANAAVTADVTIRQYKYVPDTLYVAVGAVVRWTNKDNIGHTVTFTAADTAAKPLTSRAQLLQINRPPSFYSSKLFEEEQTFVARFDQPGTFGYICDPHPYMKAVVIVR
jgi:plastocyanin